MFASGHWSNFHFRKDEAWVRDFIVHLSGVISRALEDAVILRMHLFTTSVKCNWDQATAWFQLDSFSFLSSIRPTVLPFFRFLFPFYYCKL